MKIRTNVAYFVLLVTAVSVGLLFFLTTAQSKMTVADIPPVPQEILADVVSYDLDLVKVTSNWPRDFTVQNISDKEISGFEIMIFAADDDGGPGEIIGWGKDPRYGKQPKLFKPKDAMTLSIPPQAVKKFQDNGKPFLFVQVWRLWVDNDPKFLYSEGSLLQQDQKKPGTYHVTRDAKGRSKHKHNHATPHITHSITPPFPLGCCTREFLDSVTFDCEITDTCDPEQDKCQITNNAYTICSYCCSHLQVTSYVPCHSVGSVCPPYLCDQNKLITHSRPCNCCGC